MKVILDLALSSDGFIARMDGDSDWVSERIENLFKQRIHEAGCLVVGNRTFKQYHGIVYPIKGALNIVMSKNVHNSTNDSDVIYARSPEETLKIAVDHSCSGIIVAGGATVSKAFLEKGLIDEIYFSIHPIRLEQGIKPFGEIDTPLNLKLLDVQYLEDGIRQEHYKLER